MNKDKKLTVKMQEIHQKINKKIKKNKIIIINN